MAEHHPKPDYMKIFVCLGVLTVVEVAVTFIPLVTVAKAVLLIALASSKAVLVAMYFMHLRFETRTLGIIVFTPFVICVFLIFMLMPDVGFKPHQSSIRAEHVESQH